MASWQRRISILLAWKHKTKKIWSFQDSHTRWIQSPFILGITLEKYLQNQIDFKSFSKVVKAKETNIYADDLVSEKNTLDKVKEINEDFLLLFVNEDFNNYVREDKMCQALTVIIISQIRSQYMQKRYRKISFGWISASNNQTKKNRWKLDIITKVEVVRSIASLAFLQELFEAVDLHVFRDASISSCSEIAYSCVSTFKIKSSFSSTIFPVINTGTQITVTPLKLPSDKCLPLIRAVSQNAVLIRNLTTS